MKTIIITMAVALFLNISNAAERHINFRNLCNQPVWLGFAGGSTNARNSGSTTCGGDGDCNDGAHCIQTGPIKQCFFKNPIPDGGSHRLNQGESRRATIPIYNNGQEAIWSGAISGRTACNGGHCETADCGAGEGSCKAGQGFQQPATQAEFTFNKNAPDYYDVEVINGMHLPISMGPSNVKGSGTYKCGTPGSKHPNTQVGSCSWNFNPPNVEYNWVTAGGNRCNSNGDCGGQQCGLSFNPGHADLLQKTCGRHLGYWSADQVCGLIPSFGAPFHCQDRLGWPNDGLTMWNLYACVGVGSCYQPGAQQSCCGCANWNEEGLPVPGQPDTDVCKNKNPIWNDRVKPTLKWLKQGCPSAYTYPYDDMSSTFTCTNNVGGVNQIDYTITFCPQNDNGVAEESSTSEHEHSSKKHHHHHNNSALE